MTVYVKENVSGSTNGIEYTNTAYNLIVEKERRDLIMHQTRQVLEKFYQGNMNYLSLQNKILSLRKIYKDPLNSQIFKKLNEIE